MTQTNILFKKTHVNENNSYNRPFTIRIEQIFRCSLKATQFIKIKHHLQKNSKPCYHLKRKKLRTIVGFIASRYKKCLYVHYRKVVYQGQVGKGKVLASYPYKETRMLLNNAVGFSSVKVKLKYVESILNSIFSVVCFLL